MQAWLRAALREVVVISASPVIAQPHAWRSAGSGWRRWPVRAVTLWPGWALWLLRNVILPDCASSRPQSSPVSRWTSAGEARIAA